MSSKKPIRMVLVYLCNGGRVLLAEKQRKIGAKKKNSYGGGIKKGETKRHAVVREVLEETRCSVRLLESQLRYRGVINFHNIKIKDGKKEKVVYRVFMYVVKNYTGLDPKKSKEMGVPVWYAINDLPYDEMMIGDRECGWVERILMSKSRVRGDIFYAPDQQTLIKPSRLIFSR